MVLFIIVIMGGEWWFQINYNCVCGGGGGGGGGGGESGNCDRIRSTIH